MYNTNLPHRTELPTSAQLKRSTWIAAAVAAAILTFVILPAEYAVDPTGVGGVLGLTQMGEIKMQLADEAKQDAAANGTDAELVARLDRIETTLHRLAAGIPTTSTDSNPEAGLTEEQPSAEQGEAPPAQPSGQAAATATEWRDEVSFALAPGAGAEIKLVMEQGERAQFFWTANGAIVNHDTHGDGGGRSISYEKGRGVAEQEGDMEAAFDGNHGWFWRNRTDSDVIVTLRAKGAYSEMKRTL